MSYNYILNVLLQDEIEKKYMIHYLHSHF